MSELYFRLGGIRGFTANELADTKPGYAIPIRELLQNSLDAKKDSSVRVDVYIEKINKKDIPHIEGYEKTLEKAIKTQKSKGSYTSNAEQIVKLIRETLEDEELDVLMFVDNGSGMDQDDLDGLLWERSNKADKSSSGSFGVGHLSSYFLSSLRYVLYATKYKDNGEIKSLFTGCPILAGHNDSDAERDNKGIILKEKPENERQPTPTFPDEFPNFIKPKMDKLQSTGSMVAVLGLTEDWGDEAEYAIVSNFFHAMALTGLEVHIHNQGKETVINDARARDLIEQNKDKVARKPGSDEILSGKAVYWAYETVFSEDSQKTLKLENGDKVQTYIKNDVDCGPTIVLIRNGMVIARHDSMSSSDVYNLRKSNNYNSFIAVIDVDQKDAPKLFKLVKDAEGPHHNKLDKKRLPKQAKKEFIDLFKELCGEIEKHLKKIEREGFDLPLFNLPSSEAIKSGDASPTDKLPGQSNSAGKTKRKTTAKNRPNSGGEKKNRQTPVIHPRRLQARKAMRYWDKGTELEIQIHATPIEQPDSKDNVYLSIALAEDNDKGRVGEFVEFVNVSVNQVKIPRSDFVETKIEKIIKDKKTGSERKEVEKKYLQIKLGKLNVDKNYKIIANVKKPTDFKDVEIALEPIFSLKQERGKSRKKSRKKGHKK